MIEKINLTGPADLLATIPHLLGITPSESFVVLTAHAGALGATLRVDAPEHVEPVNYAQTLTSHAANDEKATASYLVVYTDENQDSYPYAAHVAALVSRAGRSPDARAERLARDLHSLDGVRHGRGAPAGADHRQPSQRDVYLLRQRHGHRRLQPRPAGHLGHAGRSTRRHRSRTLRKHAPRGRPCWTAPGPPTSETARSIAGAFQHKMVRDFLFRETITTQNGNFADVILGTFTGRPDWNRVDRAQAIAFELMKAVPAGQRAPMLTLMGWLEWLKGNGTQAGRYLKHADTDAPGFRLAGLLLELINRGSVAEVARDPETSYQRHNN